MTISYIDSNERANVRERRAELAEYGFVCACAKCAPRLSKCPLCRAVVKGRRRIYMA